MIYILIKGYPVDSQGRCKHYHTKKDIVLIKFKCCHTYYPCYKCHEESSDHDVELWDKSEWDKDIIMCGNCAHEMSVNRYMEKGLCDNCHSPFNPKCESHYHLYFDI